MADIKSKKFFDGLTGAMKAGGLSLIVFIILRSLEGRRAVRQLQRLTGAVLNRGTIESGEALAWIRKWGQAERTRILTHGMAAATAVVIFGMLCICAASVISNPLLEGVIITALYAGIIILIHGILATILPIWAIGSAIVRGTSKIGEMELSADAFKKAPEWFFGTLTAMGGEVATQVGAVYRWFTRIVGWVGVGAAYIWIVPFHQAPELLAGLALPIIVIFYAFNQGWRAEEEYKERTSTWKAVVISTALMMLNMAFLANFPEVHDPLMSGANSGNLFLRIIMWVMVIVQIVMVVRWSTDKSAQPAGGQRRAATMPHNLVGWIIAGLVVLLIAYVCIHYELDLRHNPTRVVQKVLGEHNAWLPQFNPNPVTMVDGKEVYKPFITETPAIEGEGSYPDSRAAVTQLGGNPDSFLVVVDLKRMGWQLTGYTVTRGDVINYEVLDRSYVGDPVTAEHPNRTPVQVPTDGLRDKDGVPVRTHRLPELERYCLTANAPYGALIMRIGHEGRPQPMTVPNGQLRLKNRWLPSGKPQEVAVAMNLMQLEMQPEKVTGSIRIVFWIERQVAA